MNHTPNPSTLKWTPTIAIALLFLVMVLADRRTGAGEPDDPSAEVLVVRRSTIDYEHSASIGSIQAGMLQDSLVAPGERVKAGQVLGRLRDDDLRAEMKLRELEAESDVEVRLNKAKHQSAISKLKTTRSLLLRNATSKEEYNLHEAEADAAKLSVEQAEQNRRLASIKLEQAQVALRSREFICPHDGVIVGVLKKKGEPVAPNEPVFKVVDTEHLQLTGRVDITDSWRLRLNMPVRVIPEIGGADLPVEREVFIGRIVFIDTHVDPLSQTCKVLVNVKNRGNLLRAGLEARLEIDPRAPLEEKAPTPAGPLNSARPSAAGERTTQVTRGMP